MPAATLRLTAVLMLSAQVAGAAESRVVDAVKRNDVVELSRLLKSGNAVDATEPDGATALHWAVYQSNRAMVSALLAGRANPNVANDFGVTPLMLASEQGDQDIVGDLLRVGADPSATKSSGESALMTATRRGHVGVVRLLLKAGANVKAHENWHQQTALMWAASGGRAAIVQLLLEAGADVNARSSVHPQVVNDLPPVYGATAGTGVKVTNESFGQVLLGGYSSLLFAARQGSPESIRLLLNAKADVNDRAADGSSALVIAAHSGNVEAAKLLLDHGADPNQSAVGFTALHVAVLRGKPELVRALLAHGADPNVRVTRVYGKRDGSDYAFGTDALGSTPALLAASYLELASLQALLAGGADPILTKPDGSDLLLSAIGRSRFDKTGGQFGGIRADPRRGGRALNAEETRLFPEGEQEERLILQVVQTLVDSGTSAQSVDSGGNTALHRAASQSLLQVIQFLVSRGADVNAKNRRGQTPLAVALSANAFNLDGTEASKPDPKVGELLRRLGAMTD